MNFRKTERVASGVMDIWLAVLEYWLLHFDCQIGVIKELFETPRDAASSRTTLYRKDLA